MTSQSILELFDEGQRKFVQSLAESMDLRRETEEETTWEAWNQEWNWTRWFLKADSDISVIYQRIPDGGPPKICVCAIFKGIRRINEGIDGDESSRDEALDSLMKYIFENVVISNFLGDTEEFDTIITNAAVWKSMKHTIKELGMWCKEPMTLVRRLEETHKMKGTTLKIELDVGLSNEREETIIWCNKIPFEVSLSDNRIICHHGLIGIIIQETGNLFLHFRWRGKRYLDQDRKRDSVCRTRKLRYHSFRKIRHVYRLDSILENSWRCPSQNSDVLVLLTIKAISLRTPCTDYSQEWSALRRVFLEIYIQNSRAARVIQRRWRVAISDPEYRIAKKRLRQEYEELSKMALECM